MAGKGGRTSTTWGGSNWINGETKPVRIPVALADEIMAYARARDRGEIPSYCHVHGNSSDAVLSAINAYKKTRSTSIHPNQFSKGNMNINTRAWDELRRFAKLVEEHPQSLGLNE